MFSAGQEIRVLQSENGPAQRATVLVDNGNGTYEVLLAKSNSEGGQELVVHSGNLHQLLEFETKDQLPASPVYGESWKTNANALFNAKDYSEALVYYKKALECITGGASTGQVYSMGEEVVVTYADRVDCKAGMVSDVDIDKKSVEIVFDSGDGEEEEEEATVPFSKLLPLAKATTDKLLQRSVYMNMARCSLKLERKGWAIKYSSIAIAIAHALAQDSSQITTAAEVGKMLSDGYYFRGKALLAACRPRFANQDCKRLQEYDSSKAASLQKEIQAFKEKTAKVNRKLARDIASWVDTAMQAQQGASGGSGRSSGRGSSGAKAGGRGVAAEEDAEDDLGVIEEGGEEAGDAAPTTVVKGVPKGQRSADTTKPAPASPAPAPPVNSDLLTPLVAGGSIVAILGVLIYFILTRLEGKAR